MKIQISDILYCDKIQISGPLHRDKILISGILYCDKVNYIWHFDIVIRYEYQHLHYDKANFVDKKVSYYMLLYYITLEL